MNSIKTVIRALSARQAARAEGRALERELADLSPSARQELEAILDRYPDDQSRDVRAILNRQAFARV